jgi:hypothetical protein
MINKKEKMMSKIEMAAEEPNTAFVIVEVVDLEADDDDDPVGWALLYAAT